MSPPPSPLQGLDCKKFTKNNEIRPFEPGSEAALEFMCQKNDCSFFLLANHNKKRPHNLVLGRMFDFHLLDMIELGVDSFTGIQQFKNRADWQLGNKPCFVFAGQEFDSKPEYQTLKSMLLDLFRGQVVDKINLRGLDHVVSVVVHQGRVQLRQYR